MCKYITAKWHVRKLNKKPGLKERWLVTEKCNSFGEERGTNVKIEIPHEESSCRPAYFALRCSSLTFEAHRALDIADSSCMWKNCHMWTQHKPASSSRSLCGDSSSSFVSRSPKKQAASSFSTCRMVFRLKEVSLDLSLGLSAGRYVWGLLSAKIWLLLSKGRQF